MRAASILKATQSNHCTIQSNAFLKIYECCLFLFFLNKSLPARLKVTSKLEASRRDRTDLTNIEKDIG